MEKQLLGPCHVSWLLGQLKLDLNFSISHYRCEHSTCGWMFLAAGGGICCPCLATETLGMDFRYLGMPATEFDDSVSCLWPIF